METGTEPQAPPRLFPDNQDINSGPTSTPLPAPIQPPPSVEQPSAGGPLPEKWWLPPPPPSAQPWSALPFARAAFSQLPPNMAGPAITLALRLEGLLGFDADRKAGVPVAEAQAKWASKLYADHPSVAASLSKPEFTPKMVDVNGQKLFMTGPNRAQFPPVPPVDPNQPINAEPVMLNGVPIPGHSAIRTKGGVHMITDQKDITALQQESALHRLITSEEASIHNAGSDQEEAMIKERLKGYRKQHRELVDTLMNKTKSSAGGTQVRERATGKFFRYKGDPSHIDQRVYEVVQ